ncbi:MAG: STAS domain-containing protein [Bacteroidales bacterium]|nr:STAS domain-containing protein [Bacteroidota bacterium]MBL6949055.1 STAS domain-containing protein [Bacteroidales bacterium]
MSLKTESNTDQVICHLSGRLDTIISQNLEPEINKYTDPGKKLIFDFSQVDYISSTFLRICLMKFKERGSEKFWIRHPKPDVKKVFMIAGLNRLLKD